MTEYDLAQVHSILCKRWKKINNLIARRAIVRAHEYHTSGDIRRLDDRIVQKYDVFWNLKDRHDTHQKKYDDFIEKIDAEDIDERLGFLDDMGQKKLISFMI